MKTRVDGVSIELTPEQIKYIKERKSAQTKSLNSFKNVLKSFGFKEVNINNVCGDKITFWTNDKHVWYAELCEDHMFMAGKGLRRSDAPPGGWTYWTPEEASEALTKALEVTDED